MFRWRSVLVFGLVLGAIPISRAVPRSAKEISEARSRQGTACIECHKKVTPKIVSDWQLSKHSQNGIDCAVCHGEDHMSAADVEKVLEELTTGHSLHSCESDVTVSR